MEKLFNLQEGEKIVKEIKPSSKLKWYFFFKGLATLGISGLITIAILLYFFVELSRIIFIPTLWLFLGIIVLFGIILNLIISSLKYGKQRYWITNKRVIYKRGLIGYRITSIPYERISDLIISRTLLERIFGFGSLHVQSLAGQTSGTTALGSEGDLLAVPNPEETQEMIFKLAKIKRKEEGLSF